jgi:hypothetical protein
MSRTKISQYSAVANDNTDVNGININEGCPPSSMNNMGREIMAALKRFQVGSDGDGVTVGGSLVVSGSTSVNTFNVDVISEKTSAAGVTVDGVLLKDSQVSTDQINEKTSATGVTIDGVLLKDSGVVTGAGTVSAPVYSTTGDTNTGIFFPAADTIAFAEGGAEAMRIDSNGNLLLNQASSFIGTNTADGSDSSVLVLSGGGGTTSARGASLFLAGNENVNPGFVELSSGNAAGSVLSLVARNTTSYMTFTTGGTLERMRIDSSGNVGIGTSSPGARLEVSAASTGAGIILSRIGSARIQLNGDGTASWGGSANQGFLTWDTNVAIVSAATSNSLRLRASGNTGMEIGTSGQIYFPSIGTTASAANAFLNSGSSPANQLLRSTSSIRYKTDVETLDPAKSEAILNFRPVWYRSLAEADRKDWSWYGLIAEEVAEIEPRLVHWSYPESEYEEVETEVEQERTVTDEDGNETTENYTETKTERKLKDDAQLAPDGVQYDRLTVMLLDVVKRQDASIKALEARIAALEQA